MVRGKFYMEGMSNVKKNYGCLRGVIYPLPPLGRPCVFTGKDNVCIYSKRESVFMKTNLVYFVI